MATKDKKKSKYGSLRSGAVSAGAHQLEKKNKGGAIQNGDKEFWKPKKGNNNIDIIPYEVTIKNHPAGIKPGELFQQLAYKLHFGVGSEDKTIACPTSIGKPCPICARRAELFKDPSATEEEIADLKAKDRVCFNIIDLNDEDKGVQLFDMSPHLFANTLYEEIAAADGEVDTVFDLDGGYSLKIRFSEKKLGRNAFLEASRIDFEEREAYDDAIIEDTLDLDTALNVLDYKVIEALFMDLDPEVPNTPDDEPEEEEKPAPRKTRTKKEPEPEPDEDDGDDQDPEPEPEPPPRRPTKAKKEEEPVEEKKTTRTRGKKEPEPEPEPDEPEEGECPHGFNFGTDCETEDECDTCDVWEACKDKLEEIQAAAKTTRKRK